MEGDELREILRTAPPERRPDSRRQPVPSPRRFQGRVRRDGLSVLRRPCSASGRGRHPCPRRPVSDLQAHPSVRRRVTPGTGFALSTDAPASGVTYDAATNLMGLVLLFVVLGPGQRSRRTTDLTRFRTPALRTAIGLAINASGAVVGTAAEAGYRSAFLTPYGGGSLLLPGLELDADAVAFGVHPLGLGRRRRRRRLLHPSGQFPDRKRD